MLGYYFFAHLTTGHIKWSDWFSPSNGPHNVTPQKCFLFLTPKNVLKRKRRLLVTMSQVYDP